VRRKSNRVFNTFLNTFLSFSLMLKSSPLPAETLNSIHTSTLRCGSDALRALYPHIQHGTVYLDHASIGPVSSRVYAAVEEHLTGRGVKVNTYGDDIELSQLCRRCVARLINAESPDRIAFFMNTSDALNIVPAGLAWRTGDRILLNDVEFPANVYPYLNLQRHGVDVEFLPTKDGEVTPEMIERAITNSGGRVRLVSLSAVQFLSGFRADLAAIGAICRKHDVIFVVDAIQAAGAVPLDVQAMQIDALAAGGQKWLMATTGVAFLYIREDLQERLEQAHLGWISVAKPWDFFRYDQELSLSATRYENGTISFPGVIGLGAAVETLLEIGVESIEAHLQNLTEHLSAELQHVKWVERVPNFSVGAKTSAGIVSAVLRHVGDGERIVAALHQAGVKVSVREGYVRFSPHCYNTHSEIETALRAVHNV
jgi:cysteine desulfurase / selenocysteine lyase